MDDTVARIDWSRDAATLDRLIRGCDPQPGALAQRGEEPVRLFDCRRVEAFGDAPAGTVEALPDGRIGIAASGGGLSIGRVRVGDGAKVAAAESDLGPGDRLR